MVRLKQKKYSEAEKAYKQSLTIRVQKKNRDGEVASLSILGILYQNLKRLEQAVNFYRQAANLLVWRKPTPHGPVNSYSLSEISSGTNCNTATKTQ